MALASFGARASGLRLERMKSSDRFADGAFHNTASVSRGLKKGSVAPTISEFLCGGQRRTPPGPLPSTSPLPHWSRPPETGLRATWLGHSTVLLEVDGHLSAGVRQVHAKSARPRKALPRSAVSDATWGKIVGLVGR
jgi:hypothetical protein